MTQHRSLFLAAAFTVLLSPAGAIAQTEPADSSILQLKYVTVLVRNYDDALSWYTKTLGLKTIEDRSFGPGRRWIVVAPDGHSSPGIVLDLPPAVKPGSQMPDEADRIGKGTDWVFQVKDCRAFYNAAKGRGVHFIAPPADKPWGTTEAMFEDLYGNIFVAESARSGTASGQHVAQ
jgi:catechol 2,3-dioxygenase-like lactoylglutathione lyase family enzyme